MLRSVPAALELMLLASPGACSKTPGYMWFKARDIFLTNSYKPQPINHAAART